MHFVLVCYALKLLLKVAGLQESGWREMLIFLLSCSVRDRWEAAMNPEESLGLINECTEPGDQGPHGRQVTCWLSLCLKPQLCQMKSTELHVLIKMVRNPSRSHPVSPLPDTLQTGESETTYNFLPLPWVCVPTSYFPPPLLLILCCHLQVFPSALCSFKVGFC